MRQQSKNKQNAFRRQGSRRLRAEGTGTARIHAILIHSEKKEEIS